MALSRCWQASTLVATAIVLACADGGWAGATTASRPVGDAHLIGSVEACSATFMKCARVSESVTLLSVHGTTLGSAVATQYATHGRFSFAVAPGKYFPSVRLVDHRCIAGEAVVRAHEDRRDDIACVKRLPRANPTA